MIHKRLEYTLLLLQPLVKLDAMTASKPKYQQEAYLHYLKERESYLEGYVEAQKERDKTLVTLYSVTFGFSLTLVKFIGFSPQYVWLLICCWLCLFLSLILILLSLIASPRAWLDELASIEHDYHQLCRNVIETSAEATSKKVNVAPNNVRLYAKITDFLNYSSYVLFVMGLLMLLAFAINDLLIFSQET